MSTQDPVDQELLREQIQSAIAASRDLGPEMDRHLVDSVVESYTKEKAARDKAISRSTPQPQTLVATPTPAAAVTETFFRGLISLAVVGALIYVLVASDGAAFWMLFFLIPLLSIVWGSRGGRNRRRRYSTYTTAYQHCCGDDDYALRQQERATRRRLKIHQMEAEIARLKQGDDD